MSFARIAGVLVIAALWAAPTATAQPAGPGAVQPEAQALLEHGLALYDTQRYAEAIAEFQRGYELSKLPAFLFAIGQARRLSGDCPGAILAFESFLRKAPPPSQDRAARELIAQCKAVQPTVAPREAPALALAPSIVDAPPEQPRSHGVAPVILGGTALAALATATVFELAASSRYHALADSCAPPRGMGCSDDQISSLSLRIDLANGLFVTAGVLAVATAVVWYVGRDERRVPLRVTGRALAFEF